MGSLNAIRTALSSRAAWRPVLVALVLFLPAGGQADGQRDPLEYFFYQSFGDLREELDSARKEGKLGLFIMFDDPQCPWCRKMKQTVLSRTDVQAAYRRSFRPIRIDSRGDEPMNDFRGASTTGRKLAFQRYRVRATPVFLFVDLTGNTLLRYTGATRDVAEFLWLVEFVGDGHYKRQRFSAFKRHKRAAANPS